ncbi:hypothetical protein FOZ63_020187 [Perkinsus olseni]|uniref:Uncharacterized protein n=1 Tax=Perkinsus olseni TaxID=32597 RepID=A0A7J6TSA4_PEROL|nr:hypothetical protein FOZ63_020187 [Perkinsus olseni]
MDEKKARWMREARPMSGFQILTLWAFIFAVPFFALRSLHRRAHPHDPDYWNGLSSGGSPYGGLGPPSSDPTDPAARKDLVRAFWNPITERWEWLGEALDPPSANELLGWINSIQPNYFESKLREGKAVMPLRSSTEIKVGYIPLDCTDTPPIVRTRPAGHCEKWDGAKQRAYDAETQEARRLAAYYRQQALGPPGYHGHPGGYPQRYGGPPPPPFGYREPQSEWPSAVKHRVTGEGIIQPYRIVDGHTSTTPSGPPAAAPPAGPPPPPSVAAFVVPPMLPRHWFIALHLLLPAASQDTLVDYDDYVASQSSSVSVVSLSFLST